MWIRACSGKSLAVLVALFLSLFVFVIAAGEAHAEEQGILPSTQWPQWCAAPPDASPPGIAPSGTAPCPPTVRPSVADTSPLDNPPAGSTANGTPPAPPFPPPHDSVPLPAPGTEEPPGQHVLPSFGAEGDLGPAPIPPAQSAPPEGVSTPPDGRGPATSPTDQPRRPKILPEEALPTPSSATDPKPASSAPHNEGPAGSQPSSAPDQLPAAKGVPPTAKGVPPSYPSPPVGSAGKQAPSAGENTSDPAPSQVRGSEAAHSTVRWVVEPLVPHALPNLAAASRGAMHEALTQTHKTVSETVAGAMGTLESWAARWLPAGEAAQGSSESTAPDPLDPLLPPLPPPLGDSPFFSLPGTGQVAFGGGVGLLLLGVLASVLILRRRDGPLSWISCEPPKPTSALLVPLERPG
jgi:hypothetical protein